MTSTSDKAQSKKAAGKTEKEFTLEEDDGFEEFETVDVPDKETLEVQTVSVSIVENDLLLSPLLD